MRGDVVLVLVLVVRDSMGRWAVWKEATWPGASAKKNQSFGVKNHNQNLGRRTNQSPPGSHWSLVFLMSPEDQR